MTAVARATRVLAGGGVVFPVRAARLGHLATGVGCAAGVVVAGVVAVDEDDLRRRRRLRGVTGASASLLAVEAGGSGCAGDCVDCCCCSRARGTRAGTAAASATPAFAIRLRRCRFVARRGIVFIFWHSEKPSHHASATTRWASAVPVKSLVVFAWLQRDARSDRGCLNRANDSRTQAEFGTSAP